MHHLSGVSPNEGQTFHKHPLRNLVAYLATISPVQVYSSNRSVQCEKKSSEKFSDIRQAIAFTPCLTEFQLRELYGLLALTPFALCSRGWEGERERAMWSVFGLNGHRMTIWKFLFHVCRVLLDSKCDKSFSSR